MNISLSTTPRIAFIDLTFNWPPVGGCWIDTYNVIDGLKKRGAEVSLFMPDFQTYYPRGSVNLPLPFDFVKIPFNRFTFNFQTVIKRFRKKVNQFNPDVIFIMDGYFMKNHLLTAFGPERCFLRFYSYEMQCINLHYYRYQENRICDKGYFENPMECHRCWFRRMPTIGRALQIGLGFKDKHPTLHFSQEYLASGAFTESYRQKMLDNFSKLKGAIVYNSFMREQLSPYVDNIHTIPSGVDCQQFTPGLPRPVNRDEPVKIFLPGRANDPLKGLPVLIEAGEILAKNNHKFEIHYTAAMDCPTVKPWLINHGWVSPDQLPDLYRKMDIVTVPSTWIEPFGITAIEGMATALPVVASRTGGLAMTTDHDVTGLLVEPGDAKELANALARLIDNPDLRSSLGKAGRERVLKYYDWDKIIDQHYIPLVDAKMSQVLRLEPLEADENDISEE